MIDIKGLREENERLRAVAQAAQVVVAEMRSEPRFELGLAVALSRLGRAMDALASTPSDDRMQSGGGSA